MMWLVEESGRVQHAFRTAPSGGGQRTLCGAPAFDELGNGAWRLVAGMDRCVVCEKLAENLPPTA